MSIFPIICCLYDTFHVIMPAHLHVTMPAISHNTCFKCCAFTTPYLQIQQFFPPTNSYLHKAKFLKLCRQTLSSKIRLPPMRYSAKCQCALFSKIAF